MSKPIKIDFVSDVVCPWCAIGLAALERAIERVGDAVRVELHFRPFELNPDMRPEGESIAEHLGRKYGLAPEQLRQNSESIRQRGAVLGFEFDMDKRDRVYNSFDAHRLLHWAGTLGPAQQRALKHALLRAYHGEGRNISETDTLVRIATSTGLDEARVRQILASDEFAQEVRGQEAFYQQQGIHAVPSVIFNDRHLVQGGQPVELFEQALRQLSGIAASTPT